MWLRATSRQNTAEDIIQFIHIPKAQNPDDTSHTKPGTNRVKTNKVPPSRRVSQLRSRRNSMLQNVVEYIDHNVFQVPSYSERFQIRTEISSELESEFESTFTRYLHNLCKNPDYLPADCLDLLRNMMNISIRHSFTSQEVDALAQRVEYLSSVVPQTLPYLFIQFGLFRKMLIIFVLSTF